MLADMSCMIVVTDSGNGQVRDVEIHKKIGNCKILENTDKVTNKDDLVGEARKIPHKFER